MLSELSLNDRIIIFGGPSLEGIDHSELGVSAEMKPPAKRGDLAVLAKGQPPQAVAIVDGLFFSQNSVSLSEIRELISLGTRVFGASSMGALKAVEAESLGMTGIGIVFRWLRFHQVTDDDEVAQTYDPDSFQPLSYSMVEYRYYLSKLVKRGLITGAARAAVLKSLKGLFFPDRTLRAFEKLLEESGLCAQSQPKFESVKARDSSLLIKAMISHRKRKNG